MVIVRWYNQIWRVLMCFYGSILLHTERIFFLPLNMLEVCPKFSDSSAWCVNLKVAKINFGFNYIKLSLVSSNACLSFEFLFVCIIKRDQNPRCQTTHSGQPSSISDTVLLFFVVFFSFYWNNRMGNECKSLV